MGSLCARCGYTHGVTYEGDFVVRSCPRCGETHDRVRYVPFKRPPMRDDGTDAYATHWGVCPTTGEPLFQICAPDGHPMARHSELAAKGAGKGEA